MISARALTRWTRRWPLWVFAAALLLKAAMPLLAGTAAELQGKATFEICSVHGIPMEAAESTPSAPSPSPDHPLPHGAEHCALTAIGALMGGELPTLSPLAVTQRNAVPRRVDASTQAHDACAGWVAQLHHGPPSVA